MLWRETPKYSANLQRHSEESGLVLLGLLTLVLRIAPLLAAQVVLVLLVLLGLLVLLLLPVLLVLG